MSKQYLSDCLSTLDIAEEEVFKDKLLSLIEQAAVNGDDYWVNVFDAILKISNEKYVEADIVIDVALAIDNKFLIGRYFKLLILYYLRKYDEAFEIIEVSFKECIDDIDDSLNVYIAKAWNIKGDIYFMREDHANAELSYNNNIKYFEQARSYYLKDEVARSFLNLAFVKYAADNEKEAITIYDATISRFQRIRNDRIKASVVEAYLGKASCLKSLNLLKEAIKIYDLVINKYYNSDSLLLKLKSYEAMFRKTYIFRDTGEIDNAIEICNHLEELTSDKTDRKLQSFFARTEILKGSILTRNRNYREAIVCYDQIINRKDGLALKNIIYPIARAYIQKSFVLNKLRESNEAIELLQYFIDNYKQSNNGRLDILVLQALIRKADYSKKNDTENIIRYYNEAIEFIEINEIDKDFEYWIKKPFESKAKIYEKLGNLEEARKTYLELLNIYPNNVEIKLSLARVTSKTDISSSTSQIKEIVEKVIQKIGDKKIFFEAHMKETNDRFNDFLCKESRLANEAFLLTLRRWNSFTPIIPVDGETSRGGGYFIRAYDNKTDNWRGLVIDPGYNFIENFCNAGGRVHDIDAIVITHAHNDHTIDFESLCSLFHKYNKVNSITKKIKIYLNVGTFMKFSGLLDLRNAKYIDDIVVLNTFDRHTIFGDIDLYVQPAYHDEVITKSHSVGLLFKFGSSTKGPNRVEDLQASDDRHILFTGDTSLYPSITVDGEPEANVKAGNEIHKLYKPEINSIKGEIEIDLLVAHIGSIYKDELDSEVAYNKRFYPNHLGIMGVVSLVNDLRPKLTLVSEFGEELMSIRLTLVEGIASIFESSFSCDGDISNEDNEGKKSKQVILPCDLSLAYKIFDRTIYCIDTHRDEPYTKVECFTEDKNLYYKTKGIKDFDRAAAVKQYKYGLNHYFEPEIKVTRKVPSYFKNNTPKK